MGGRRSTLIQTVGTSLLTNLRDERIGSDFDGWLRSQPESERRTLEERRETIQSAAGAAQRGRWGDAAVPLAAIPGRVRLLGAEVSSLETLRGEAAYAALRSVVLLHSDTEDGACAAEMLQAILGERLALAVERRRIVQLQDDHPAAFKVFGLRNLVRELAAITRVRGASEVVIDATGGFKAQIAVAVAFGQAFGIPVLYQFERFPEIIEIPPLPLTVDLSAAAEHHDLLQQGEIAAAALAARFGEPLSEANAAFARFSVCLLGPLEGPRGRRYAVSAMGQLLLELWQSQGEPLH